MSQYQPRDVLYIASPYYDKDPDTRYVRSTLAKHYTHHLTGKTTYDPSQMIDGMRLFSPIAMWNELIRFGKEPSLSEFHSHSIGHILSEEIFHKMKRLIILAIPGWGQSKGVKKEWIYAAEHDLDIQYWKPRLYSGDYQEMSAKDMKTVILTKDINTLYALRWTRINDKTDYAVHEDTIQDITEEWLRDSHIV